MFINLMLILMQKIKVSNVSILWMLTLGECWQMQEAQESTNKVRGVTDDPRRHRRAQAAANEPRQLQTSPKEAQGSTNEPRRLQTSSWGLQTSQGGTDEARQLQMSAGGCRRAKGGTDKPRQLQMDPGSCRRTQAVADGPRRSPGDYKRAHGGYRRAKGV